MLKDPRKAFLLFLYSFTLVCANNLNITKYDRKLTIDLKKVDDDYTAPVWLGSNSQLMKVVFSTGDYLSWIPSSECINCGEGGFNFSNSTNFKNYTGMHKISYPQNNGIEGYYVSDTLKLNSENNKINNFYFFLVNKKENISSSTGVVGLNLKPQNEKNNNFVSQLFDAGLITSQKFSLYYSDRVSKLLMGDFSESTTFSSLYKLMSFCKVPDKADSWECELTSVDINKYTLNPGSKLRVNTRINELVLPLIDYKIIKKHFAESLKTECMRNEQGKLTCKCGSPSIFPNFVLYINTDPFVIILKNLIEFYPSQTYQCSFNILIDLENEDTWVLGKSVLTNTLLSFDQSKRKLGFIQNPKNFESFLINENIIVNPNEQNDSKIGFIFFLFFLFLLMFFLIKCANNDQFFARRSLNPDDHQDRIKVELIKNRFNAEEYDYDDMKPREKGTKYLEMKEIVTK